MVRASEKGPQIVAEDLYTVPQGLIPKRRKPNFRNPDLHVFPHERKRKVPTVK